MNTSGLPDLTSRQLQTVLALAEYGSFIAAAALLKTSQPAVTRTVKHVEDLLGIKLFDRADVESRRDGVAVRDDARLRQGRSGLGDRSEERRRRLPRKGTECRSGPGTTSSARSGSHHPQGERAFACRSGSHVPSEEFLEQIPALKTHLYALRIKPGYQDFLGI